MALQPAVHHTPSLHTARNDLAALPRYNAQLHYRATPPDRTPATPPVSPAADGSWVSMGVYSDGSYGAPKVRLFCAAVLLSLFGVAGDTQGDGCVCSDGGNSTP